MEETLEPFQRTKKRIRVEKELFPELLNIRADSSQVEQILFNLYINAADAMPEGGNLFIKTCNVTDEDMQGSAYNPKKGKYVLLSIADTGIGMDENVRSRIFEPFFTTKAAGKGTGLGLASVYGIIKGHGGYIDVASKVMQGTRFSIYLPVMEKSTVNIAPVR